MVPVLARNRDQRVLLFNCSRSFFFPIHANRLRTGGATQSETTPAGCPTPAPPHAAPRRRRRRPPRSGRPRHLLHTRHLSSTAAPPARALHGRPHAVDASRAPDAGRTPTPLPCPDAASPSLPIDPRPPSPLRTYCTRPSVGKIRPNVGKIFFLYNVYLLFTKMLANLQF